MRDLTRIILMGLASTTLATGGLAACDGNQGRRVEDRTGALSFEFQAPACGEHVTALFAGQNTPAGSVIISNTSDTLIIDVLGNTDWGFEQVHIYAGTTPPETVAPGQFPYSQGFDLPTFSYRLEIPLADIGVSATCGANIFVAVHTESVQVDGDVIVARETGWSYGVPFEGPRWGWYVDYGLCCPEEPPVEENGCTLTQGYWKTHNAYATKRSLRRDWPLPEDEDAFLCDGTWLEILDTNAATGDAWIILAHQFIAARLNVAAGASTGEQVDEALAAAQQLLSSSCGIADADRAVALDYAAVLDAYNNGLIGPGHCK